jgi:deoxyribose-phosphate aldolase
VPRRDLSSLIERARAATADPALARRAVALVDLTSLRGDETAAEIEGLCARAKDAGTAAVCIYPARRAVARAARAGSPVRLAAVANFPQGSDDIAAATAEVGAAVAAGAQEVDLVAPIGAIMEGDVGLVDEMVEAARAAAGPGITLKLILETGTLAEPERITAAARAAVMAGADFLKTSTGKGPVGATLEAAVLLLEVIEEAGGRVGFKAAGGIRTGADAAGYLLLADELLGPAWATPSTFRFGASGLLDDLLRLAGHATAALAAQPSGY